MSTSSSARSIFTSALDIRDVTAQWTMMRMTIMKLGRYLHRKMIPQHSKVEQRECPRGLRRRRRRRLNGPKNVEQNQFTLQPIALGAASFRSAHVGFLLDWSIVGETEQR